MRAPAAVLAIAALVLLAACRSNRAGTSDANPASTGVSRATGARLSTPYPIEPFDAIDLDGRRVSLADWKNSIVVINVWATWCGPCRRELPMLAALQTRYRDRVRVLGVLQDNVTDAFARQFAGQVGLNFPVIRSTFEIEHRLPAVMVLPMTFVLDREGRLVSSYAGEAD